MKLAAGPCIWECTVPAALQTTHPAAEWYAPFSALRPLLQAQAQCSDTILLLAGPQDSCLHEDLYDSGYRGVTVVHSDSDRIQAWRQQQADHSRSIECQVAAMAEGLAFDHNPYNVIIDKGYLDAVLCKDTGGFQEAEAALLNVWNNLKGPGTYLLFTHGPPSLRLPLIHKHAWASTVAKAIVPAEGDNLQLVSVDAQPVDAAAFVYICKKPYVWHCSGVIYTAT